jgi:hypothetical protein
MSIDHYIGSAFLNALWFLGESITLIKLVLLEAKYTLKNNLWNGRSIYLYRYIVANKGLSGKKTNKKNKAKHNS